MHNSSQHHKQIHPMSPDLTASLAKLNQMVLLCDQTPESWLDYYEAVDAELSAFVREVTLGAHPTLTLQDPRFQTVVLQHTALLDVTAQVMAKITVSQDTQEQ